RFGEGLAGVKRRQTEVRRLLQAKVEVGGRLDFLSAQLQDARRLPGGYIAGAENDPGDAQVCSQPAVHEQPPCLATGLEEYTQPNRGHVSRSPDRGPSMEPCKSRSPPVSETRLFGAG